MSSPTPESTTADPQINAYQRLRALILEGEMAPGTRISEPELAVLFGVSRSPVREALLRLERDGFVVRGQSGRVTVAPLEVSELQELYVVRANLEGLATRLAASRLRTVDLEEMAALVDAMRDRVAGHRFREAILIGRQFHGILHRECNNRSLIDALSQIEGRIDRFRHYAASFDTYDPGRVEEHQRVLDALYLRDARGAEANMILHIENSSNSLIQRMKDTRNG